MLPHAYPFRLIERKRGERVRVALSADASWLRGAASLPQALAVEMLAQATLLFLPADAEEDSDAGENQGFLAGVDEARFHHPLRAGDLLEIQIDQIGGFGRMLKVAGAMRRQGGEVVTEAKLLLAR